VDAATLAAGAAIALAALVRRAREPIAWVLLATILALLFLDEISGLHARVDTLDHGKLLYAPLLALLAAAAWRVTRRTAQLSNLRAGAALLLASYAIHVLEPHSIARALGWSANGWAFQSVVATKEGTELAGLLLALLALACAAASDGVQPRRG
jgi:hypothetical protein